MPIPPSNFEKATLTPLPDGDPITVHFNPTTLTYAVENSAPQTAGHPNTTQFVAQVSGKLSMDLEFDTTDVGTDVRLITNQIAEFMSPPQPSGGSSSGTPPSAPLVLEFSWGTYTFDGILQSFTETIDFFSADGVALRAKISISLSEQDQIFPTSSSDAPASPATSASIVAMQAGGSVSVAAALGGDASAARQLGSDNGVESLRFGAGASLQVGGGVSLNAAAGFSAGASGSVSAGLGLSASASLGVSAGAGISLQSSGSGPIFGASASAGVPATAGAFAGLQVGVATVSTTTRLNTSLMLPSTSGSDLSTAAGASFSLGGSANSAAAPGLSANVGATASLNAALTFDGD